MRLAFTAALALLTFGCHRADPPAPSPAPVSLVEEPSGASEVAAPPDPELETARAARSTKESATPSFWQKDPEGGFPNRGADYCAPVALSGGILYLRQARGLESLTSGTDKAAQIRLVKELARDLSTDPKRGTTTDEVITGIERFAASRGVRVSRLDLGTWHSAARRARGAHVISQPDLAWLRRAAADPTTVVLANVGWYRHAGGGYERKGGHWVNVVASGSDGFELRNPAIAEAEQTTKTHVRVTPLSGFHRSGGGAQWHASDAYRVDGPGLPHHTDLETGVLDDVIVFSLKQGAHHAPSARR